MSYIAGFLSGIAGAMGLGGGSVLLLYLTLIASVPQLNAQGINLIFFIPCALVSVFLHNRNKLVKWRVVLPVAIGGLFGIWLGQWILSFIEPHTLSKVFGAFLIFFGLIELFSKKREDKNKNPR